LNSLTINLIFNNQALFEILISFKENIFSNKYSYRNIVFL
jgi:hypothetical protein